MQSLTFYTLLRTYSDQARRRGVSYAEQVDTIIRLRTLSIAASEASDEEKERQTAAIRRAAENEYARHDPAWHLPT